MSWERFRRPGSWAGRITYSSRWAGALVATALCLTSLGSSEVGAQPSRRAGVYVDVVSFVPASKGIRGNYRQSLGAPFVAIEGTSGVPVNAGLGFSYWLSERNCLYIDVHGFQRRLHSDSRILLQINPVVVGLRRLITGTEEEEATRVYVGGGFGLCISKLTGTHPLTLETGPGVVGLSEFAHTYLGMVIRFEAGFQRRVAGAWLGIVLGYDLADGGSAEGGGLGEVGGFSGGLRFAVEF